MYDPTQTGLEQITTDLTSVLYPNPANEVINLMVNIPVNDDFTISVIDMSGKVLYAEKQNVNTGVTTFTYNAGNLANGLYSMNITGTTYQTVKKFVVQH